LKQYISKYMLGDYFFSKRFWIFPIILWTILVSGSLYWNVYLQKHHSLEEARIQGKQMFSLIQSMRLWNAKHSGVYVEVTKDTQPNPYLDSLDRDILTNKGQWYTMINPAYMTRQLSEITDIQKKVTIHITSLKPIRPANIADEWETIALKEFEKGQTEKISLLHDETPKVFRYMSVLKVEEPCLKCHAKQGYKVGDIRGGISVTFVADQMLILHKEQTYNMLIMHIFIYLIVSFLIIFIFHQTRKKWLLLVTIQGDQEQKIENRTQELRDINDVLSNELIAHKRTSDSLIKSEARLIAITDSASDAIITADIESNIISWNNAAVKMFGYTAQEMIGKCLVILMPESYRDGHIKGIDNFINTGVKNIIGRTIEISGLRKDGVEFPIEISLSVSKTDDQVFFTGIVRDITQRKQLETQLIDLNYTLEQRVSEEIENGRRKEQMLVQQSKMASMGEMLGAIAHQWRQPLNALGLIIQDIKEAYQSEELNQEYIDQSIKDSMVQILYMSHTIDDFRNFFRTSKQKEVFNVIRSIEFTLSIFSAQMKEHSIKIDTVFNEDDDILVDGFFNEFNQVILNIMSNAKDAILEARENGILGTDGGQIIVRVLKEDDRAVLKIGNNGGRIPDNLIDTIFEPYFTTKEEGKGTGIGLYMSKTIIEQNMNGRIYVENIDYGVIFTIYLELYHD